MGPGRLGSFKAARSLPRTVGRPLGSADGTRPNPRSTSDLPRSGVMSSVNALRPVLVVALDGASFDVIEPMAAAGELPNLARWMKEGRAGGLPSTIPPVTFPAWSSFMTGLAPAEHGIFDFTQKQPGRYRLRFVNSTDREARSIFRRVCDVGERVLVLGLPATHPPEGLDGLLVCGFERPSAARSARRIRGRSPRHTRCPRGSRGRLGRDWCCSAPAPHRARRRSVPAASTGTGTPPHL